MEALRIHHTPRLRPIRAIQSVTPAFHGGLLAQREPPLEPLPSRSLRLPRSEPSTRDLRCGEPPLEHVLLFDAPAVSIPLRAIASTTSPNARDAWCLDATPPDTLVLSSPRALARLGWSPLSRALAAGVIACVVLDPCLAEAAVPPAPSTVLASEPPQAENAPQQRTQGLPDSVFQVALKQRVELLLPSSMTVTGTILAMDATTITFSTELDGTILVIQRVDISGIRLVGAATAPSVQPSRPPSPGSTTSPAPEPVDDWVPPDFQLQLDEAERLKRSGLSWKAYLAYKEALELSSPTRAYAVTEEIELLRARMRRIGLGLWIPGTVLTAAGFGVTSTIWIYGGFALHIVGIPMLVVGAAMHSRATKIREELPILRRRFATRTRWNGGLSWSF